MDPNGKPAEGATVSLVIYTEDGRRVGSQAKTGADGRYRLDRGLKSPREIVGQIVVTAPGSAVVFEDLFRNPAPPEIRLAKGASVKVTLQQSDGRPAAGVLVKPRVLVRRTAPRMVSFFSYYPEIPAPAATTDANGRCELGGFPAGDDLQLDVVDDRFAHLGFQETIHLRSDGAPTEASVKLKPGAILTGKVTRDGAPVSGVRVVAQGLNYSGGGEAATGADGAYRLVGLEAGAYNVELYLPQPLRDQLTAVAKEALAVAPGERKPGIDFSLIPGAVITGTLTSPDGKPLEGQPIGVYGPAFPRSGAAVGSTMTGPDGKYRIRVPAGSQFVYVMQENGPNQTITIKDGQTATVDFKYAAPREETVVGSVVDETGRPVPNAVVDLAAPDAMATETVDPVKTGPDGTFALKVHVKGPFVARARTDTDSTVVGVRVSPGTPTTLRVKKGALGKIAGKVIDEKGRPIVGAKADLVSWTGDYGHSAGRATTGADGAYLFDGLYPDLDVTVSLSAEGRGVGSTDRLRPIPGEVVHAKPTPLPVADSFVAGRVVDEQGKAVAGARITPMQYADRTVGTDNQGRFRIDALPKGEHQLGISLGDRFLMRSIQAGTLGYEFVLKRGSVETPSGDVLAEAAPPSLLGKKAPALQVSEWVNGTPNLKGKIVVIDFWGIWCGPCRATLPDVRKLAAKYKGTNVAVIGVHDSSTWRKELTAFAKKNSLTYPIAIDRTTGSKMRLGKTMQAYGVQGIPSFAVIDAKGNVAYMGSEHQAAEATVERLRKLGQ